MVTEVMVKRRHLILGTVVAVLAVGLAPEARAANCSATSTGLTALSDLGPGRYHGFTGGLYPGGANHPVAAYARLGRSQARLVVPRGIDGAPARNGRIVLLSIGMSNASAEFSQFRDDASRDPNKNRRVVVVDGAQGGADAERVANPNGPYWAAVDQRLRAAGVSGAQVQAVWLKEAIAGEHESFPVDARHLHLSERVRRALADRRPRQPPCRRPVAGLGALPMDRRTARPSRRPDLDLRRRRRRRHPPLRQRSRQGLPTAFALL